MAHAGGDGKPISVFQQTPGKMNPKGVEKGSIVVLLIDVFNLLSGLAPDAQTLCIECLFVLVLVTLLIIAFSPTGADRVSHFIAQLRWLFTRQQRPPFHHPKRQRAAHTQVERRKEEAHEHTR